MDKIKDTKAYKAPETSAMKARDIEMPVHWNSTNDRPIESNQGMWDDEDPTTTYSFNLWDE
ncbi:MAG: hypothetical protein IKX22_12015 [Prevotella sp.]|nr:hypothetical protein [Prevotella sp.]